MDPSHATLTMPATPDYVLEVFRDVHRQALEYDPNAEDIELGFDSTVAEWRLARDLVDWQALGAALDAEWCTTHTEPEWQAVLCPAEQRRLRGVCELLARSARQPLVRPGRLLGAACRTAGVFLTVCSLLRDVDPEAAAIRPSTGLAPFTRRHAGLFLGAISRLAPGALPPVKISTPLDDSLTFAGLLGGLAIVVGAWTPYRWIVWGGVLWFLTSIALSHVVVRTTLPRSVTFGDLRTFGDLAQALAKGATFA